jgi:hypothetical protein
MKEEIVSIQVFPVNNKIAIYLNKANKTFRIENVEFLQFKTLNGTDNKVAITKIYPITTSSISEGCSRFEEYNTSKEVIIIEKDKKDSTCTTLINNGYNHTIN